MSEVTRSLVINAMPSRVLGAFFDPKALAAWWEVTRAVCVPKLLGSYALQWEPTEWRDELLGRLGGTLHGTVVEYSEGTEFLVADLYWHPPDGDPIGPMALEVTCIYKGPFTTELKIRHSGCDASSPRWRRYYEVMESGWTLALSALKKFLEQRSA
jgi:uncharacterized protein YndB with AHSA1/START domain